jgi:ribosomal protein L18E
MQNSLHISHLDDAVSQLLHEMAREQGISVEEVVKKYLMELRTSREHTKTSKIKKPFSAACVVLGVMPMLVNLN